MWKTIAQQFAKPEGFGGSCAAKMMNLMNYQMYKDVIKLIKDDKQKILDVGFGNGYVMKRVMDKGHIVYGLEISERMIKQVINKNQKALNHTMFIKKGIMEHLPYEEQSFDVIYSINTIYFWESLDAGLKELHRCLKKEGKAILSFYDQSFLSVMPYSSHGFRLYKKETVIQAIHANGFKVIKKIEHRHKTMLSVYMERNDLGGI